MTKLIRWLFDSWGWVEAYGTQGLYRRTARTHKIQYKDIMGWQSIDEWPTKQHEFTPVGDIGYIKLPDHGSIPYSRAMRNDIGEIKFQNWIDRERKNNLEQIIRRKAKLVVK